MSETRLNSYDLFYNKSHFQIFIAYTFLSWCHRIRSRSLFYREIDKCDKNRKFQIIFSLKIVFKLGSIAILSLIGYFFYFTKFKVPRDRIFPLRIKPLELMTEFYVEFSRESRETGLRDTRKEEHRVRPPTPLMPAYFATRRAERQRLDSRCARYFSRTTFHAYGIDDDFSTGRLPRCSTDGLLYWHFVRSS